MFDGGIGDITCGGLPGGIAVVWIADDLMQGTQRNQMEVFGKDDVGSVRMSKSKREKNCSRRTRL